MQFCKAPKIAGLEMFLAFLMKAYTAESKTEINPPELIPGLRGTYLSIPILSSPPILKSSNNGLMSINMPLLLKHGLDLLESITMNSGKKNLPIWERLSSQ